MALLAHYVSCTVNALRLPWDRNPRSPQTVDRLANVLSLDMAKDWTPTVDSYLGRVTKAHILEGVSEDAARRIADMAQAAEQLLAGTGWLPAILRTLEQQAELPSDAAVPAAQAEDGEDF